MMRGEQEPIGLTLTQAAALLAGDPFQEAPPETADDVLTPLDGPREWTVDYPKRLRGES